LVQIALVVYCVLSWFANPRNPALRFLSRMFEPVLQPIRRALRRGTNSETWSGLAPMVAALLIQALCGLLMNI